MPTKDESAASRTKRFANQRPGGDVPCWLRRTYTRTIPKDIRTTQELQRSFEDIREQWRDLCEAYTHAKAKSSWQVESAIEETVPHGTRSAVERLVSQLKSVKQELLAHLSRLSGALAGPAAPLPTEASASALPAWVSDVMGCSHNSRARTVRVEPCSEAMQSYLQAIWLARRVWVWSLCFASVAMDLELLSGSVSVAAELFFGNAFDTAVAPELGEAHLTQRDSRAFHSAYNMGGSISEALLYATVEATAAKEPTESRAGNAIARLDDSDSPPHFAAKVDEEACEVAAFFGCSVSAARYTADTVAGVPSTHADSHAAAVKGEGRTRSLETSSAPWVRDLFWVHAVALCYSVMARDDTSAARLLSVFETAKRSFSVEEAEGSTEGTEPSSLTTAKAAEQPNPLQQSPVLQAATVFVLLAAKLIADEDYNAVQQLLHRAGFGSCDGRRSESGAQGCSTLSLAALCPQGVLLRFLIRLLAEHVVRRQWTERGLGQAFRPMEPFDVGADAAAAGSGIPNASNRHRLACALATRASTDDTAERTQPGSCVTTWSLFHATQHLCDALQMAALRSMGGDWPLPPALLRHAFA
ncbi:conserved hypothetical protein [Leishmania major strain Friedlin]|uniref:Uncharacterized protein n=1 Tax=Leishmania major TaxID=5664 RepID=Q4Q3T9_LEIMA|nr:conserved hypothetical protein [Leishmania major strain Friedlin]CAG9580882.1 hypothetical_protein_-_conserved [Leishmania major strain Friedlin]CAJ06680.1 conserved hypothetical protein [Leishmania major strain Friedlin]|eukprot:XP_001686009.1 conserved hypothetical protein [Leishmania major strain Friedlin]